MHRIPTTPRPDWQDRVQLDSFIFHTADDIPYWDESAYYRFSGPQIHDIERATAELQRLCIDAGQHILDNDLFARLDIPDWAEPLIRRAWDEEPPALYGRFDLAYDGRNPPKMLEYNADTPTSLFEAAVVQWNWLQDVHPHLDQFNSLHERLIEKWADIAAGLPSPEVHFCHERDSIEDMITVAYLQDTAQQAGLATLPLVMDELGWGEGGLLDLDGQEIHTLFKLYPWEWLLDEADAAGRRNVFTIGNTTWIEPIWKMLWSNKGLLPILWELFPGHPNLLPAFFDHPHGLEEYAAKPLLSREGANIEIVRRDLIIETPGPYDEGARIYQALAPLPSFDGNTPVLGSWVVDGEPAGLGIRESHGPITDNLSRFLPHIIG